MKVSRKISQRVLGTAFCFFSIFLSLNAFSQSTAQDSILAEEYMALAISCSMENPSTKRETFAINAAKYAKRIENWEIYGHASIILAEIYLRWEGKRQACKDILKEIKPIIQEHFSEKDYIKTQFYYLSAKVYFDFKNLEGARDIALEMIWKNIHIYEEGIVFSPIWQKQFNFHESSPKDDIISNIAKHYLFLGEIYLNSNQLDSSITCFEFAKKYFEIGIINRVISWSDIFEYHRRSVQGLASCYEQKRDYQYAGKLILDASVFLEQNRKLSEGQKAMFDSQLHTIFGNYYTRIHEPKIAIDHYNEVPWKSYHTYILQAIAFET